MGALASSGLGGGGGGVLVFETVTPSDNMITLGVVSLNSIIRSLRSSRALPMSFLVMTCDCCVMSWRTCSLKYSTNSAWQAASTRKIRLIPKIKYRRILTDTPYCSTRAWIT